MSDRKHFRCTAVYDILTDQPVIPLKSLSYTIACACKGHQGDVVRYRQTFELD
jgi:hypothetical protein